MVLIGVDAVQQHVPHTLGAVDPGERVLDRARSSLILGSEQPLGGDVGEVVIPQLDHAEAAGLVAEGVIERLLLGAGDAGVREPLLQLHLAGDDRDQRDGQATVVALDELGELLRLPAQAPLVLHLKGEPEHELIEEHHHRVVPEGLRVIADGLQPLIETDVLAETGVVAEQPVGTGQVGDQALLVCGAGGGGAGSLVLLQTPAAGSEQGAERVVAGAVPTERGEEQLVAHASSEVLGVPQQGVRLVDGGQRRVGVKGADLPHVPVEEHLLHGAAVEEVERQRQEVLALELGVVAGDDLLQVAVGAGVRVVAQQGVEHGHEVRLAGAEGAGEERATVQPSAEGVADQVQRLVEGLGDRGGDHVVVDRLGGAAAAGRVGEAQHVVLGAGGLGDREDIFEQGRGHDLGFRPRVAAGGRQESRSSSLAPTWARRWS